jgi:hypothetical protein
LARVYHQLGRYGDARALLRDTVDRLQRILPDDDPLTLELREILADIGDELSSGACPVRGLISDEGMFHIQNA